MNRPLSFLVAVAVSASGIASFTVACTDNGAATGGDPTDPDARASKDGAAGESSTPDPDGGAQEDTGITPSTCALTREYTTECNKRVPPDAAAELTCGNAKFDAWCELNDKAINSEAFRRGQAQCLTTKNCVTTTRHDCEYSSYGSATPTAAQKAVVAAFCTSCEPADTTCAARKTTYDTAKGPSSVDDVFIAAWELNDALSDLIRTKCTGAALDAGATAATCLKNFGNCAGGIYVDHLPNCPK